MLPILERLLHGIQKRIWLLLIFDMGQNLSKYSDDIIRVSFYMTTSHKPQNHVAIRNDGFARLWEVS
jgi:hypothetical protein